MNYIKIHDQLIQKRQSNPLPENEYGENHHILPVALGGSDDESNLVRLSAREHYIIHHLLWKHHRSPKTAHAFNNMRRTSSNQERHFTARQHEVAIKAHSEAMKETMKGEGNHFYGRTHSEETKRLISVKQTGKKASKETKKKMSDARKGVKKTLEHRERIGRKGMIMLKNANTHECIRISKTDQSLYDSEIWKNPAVWQKRTTCIHCGKTSVVGMITRWHNDNCKSKPE